MTPDQLEYRLIELLASPAVFACLALAVFIVAAWVIFEAGRR